MKGDYFAIKDKAAAADSLTSGSNSSKQITRLSRAPLATTFVARSGECFATFFKT